MSCYTYEELKSLGIAEVGENVMVHRTVQFFSPHNIHLGNNVRIDCFSLLSAGVEGIYVGSRVHIAAGCYLFGVGGRIQISDFCGLSSRVTIYTSTDDYSSGYMTNPTVPDEYRKVTNGSVTLNKHALIGSGSIVMPNVEIGEAVSIGALTFINKNIGSFNIVHGNPARLIGKRSEKILEMERSFLDAAKP